MLAQRPLCPHCNAPIVKRRLGLRLPPIKAEIFDAVKRSGTEGIARAALDSLIYGRMRHDKTARIRSHVTQINELLAPKGYRIVTVHGGTARAYRLERDRR